MSINFYGGYQAQADHFLTSKMGLSSEELSVFYDFAREGDNAGLLRQALEAQLYGNNMSAWRPLVERYMSNVAPSSETLKARGFKTRTTAEGETLVRTKGTWGLQHKTSPRKRLHLQVAQISIALDRASSEYWLRGKICGNSCGNFIITTHHPLAFMRLFGPL